MNQMIAICGIDCEHCDAYIATKNNDNVLREKTAKKWSELNGVEILAEAINCEGCRTDGVKTAFCENMCPIKKCASKKEFGTCGDCEKLDNCQMLDSIHKSDPNAMNNLHS